MNTGQLILDSVGKQTEFGIIGGPKSKVLGIFVCNVSPSIVEAEPKVEFNIIIGNDPGETVEVSYFIQPWNLSKGGYFAIVGKNILFRGSIVEFEIDKSSLKKEKHELLKDGSVVDIIFNETTGKGVLSIPDKEDDGPAGVFKYVKERVGEAGSLEKLIQENVLMN